MNNNLTLDNKTILIVDDTESNIDILLEILGNYDLIVATDGFSAIEIANEDKIDLILLDILMPEIDGFEVCRRLKLNDNTKNIPIIFITAKTDEESIERAYDVGGIDYVSKPFKPKELLARVKKELKLSSLINHLNYLVAHDVMTGVYNRREFFKMATKYFEIHKDLFAIMLDIDDFKAINDQHGHAVGDKVIQAVSKTISIFIDEQSIFGRLGGEEFAFICNNKPYEIVIKKVEKIRHAIEQLEITTEDNKIVKLTISSGISKKQTDTKNLDYLLKIADDLLYEAKRQGKNKVIFSP